MNHRLFFGHDFTDYVKFDSRNNNILRFGFALVIFLQNNKYLGHIADFMYFAKRQQVYRLDRCTQVYWHVMLRIIVLYFSDVLHS